MADMDTKNVKGSTDRGDVPIRRRLRGLGFRKLQSVYVVQSMILEIKRI